MNMKLFNVEEADLFSFISTWTKNSFYKQKILI